MCVYVYACACVCTVHHVLCVHCVCTMCVCGHVCVHACASESVCVYCVCVLCVCVCVCVCGYCKTCFVREQVYCNVVED